MNSSNDQEWSSEVSKNNTSIISYGDDVLDLSFNQCGIKFEEGNRCYWGDDCSNCRDYSGKEEDRFCMECDQCKKPMTDHEGYVMCETDLYCNLCILDNDYDKRHADFFKSFDENMDYSLWLDSQIKLYGDDPEFQRNLNSFAPCRYQQIVKPAWTPAWVEEDDDVASENFANAPIKSLLMEIERVLNK
jgi:hypothetical protein